MSCYLFLLVYQINDFWTIDKCSIDNASLLREEHLKSFCAWLSFIMLLPMGYRLFEVVLTTSG